MQRSHSYQKNVPQMVKEYCGRKIMRTVINGKGLYYDECRLNDGAVVVECCPGVNGKRIYMVISNGNQWGLPGEEIDATGQSTQVFSSVEEAVDIYLDFQKTQN